MRLTLGYVRVSTIEQEQGYGPEVQTEKIKTYAEKYDLGSPEIHQESGSGSDLTKRKELHLVLARAEAVAEEGGEANIIFYSLDRLSRDLINQESITIKCFDKGIRLHSTQEAENDTLDPAYAGDPMRVAIRQFFGIIHQLDRAIIQRRLEGGLARKGIAGGFTGGRTPFGYKSENQDLVVAPEQASVVRKIFALHRHGVDQTTIAAIVAANHLVAAGFRKQTVSRILSRKDLYQGGKYKPRGSDVTTIRPELIIDHRDDPEQEQELEDLQIDWDKLPDPMRLSNLALLLGKEPEELRKIIVNKGLVVKFKRNDTYIPKKAQNKLRKELKTQSK